MVSKLTKIGSLNAIYSSLLNIGETERKGKEKKKKIKGILKTCTGHVAVAVRWCSGIPEDPRMYSVRAEQIHSPQAKQIDLVSRHSQLNCLICVTG